LLRAVRGPRPRTRTALRRALHGRWHVDRGVGQPQEFQTYGCPAASPGCSREPDGELPRRAAEQRDPRFDDGPGGAALSEGRLPRGQALLPRSEEHTSELQSLAYLVCRLL